MSLSCSLSQLSGRSGNHPLLDIMKLSDERSLLICRHDALYYRARYLLKSNIIRFGTDVINTTYI